MSTLEAMEELRDMLHVHLHTEDVIHAAIYEIIGDTTYIDAPLSNVIVEILDDIEIETIY